ncbi:sigma-70 family RNA polymerase sigma factor [Synechococcus sp. CS-1328]|uniref:sigma-70 family RNA polymerase sigma factor n=1 Tax=Synechococcus sp. CS-1328 TaxID=2847976 RepID=UPI00223BC9CF|nr:sigma-70 family RNA polymerase sigma factor [Synechococcus sp. CS-1328]MCT0225253.1 sigma-70 family RNA polymerase sigma factor [Synechococcus sp. CS-1328]
MVGSIVPLFRSSSPAASTAASAAAASAPAAPRRWAGPADPAAINRAWLAAYACSSEAHVRLHWRNALVQVNLPLVRLQARLQAASTDLPLDDLIQLGAIGLLRAVEAFDLQRRVSLSSFAVPYIRGTMQQYLRDRHRPLRAPWRLRQLQQRVERLQALRLHAGQPPLSAAELARQLSCSTEALRQAADLQTCERLRSLDAPIGGDDGEGCSSCLLDQLADPATSVSADFESVAFESAAFESVAFDPAASAAAEPTENDQDPQDHTILNWLRQRLAQLSLQERQLLNGRHLQGDTWVALGRELGLHPRMAQRRTDALLQGLQREAQQWQELNRPAMQQN